MARDAKYKVCDLVVLDNGNRYTVLSSWLVSPHFCYGPGSFTTDMEPVRLYQLGGLCSPVPEDRIVGLANCVVIQ